MDGEFNYEKNGDTMKLSIVAVSALVISTSFAATGWADSHEPQGVASEPGGGGRNVAEDAGEAGSPMLDLVKGPSRPEGGWNVAPSRENLQGLRPLACGPC